PQARGTSIAIGWAALVLLQKDPEAIIATINSDHHIKEEEKYIQAIKDSENIIEKNPDKILLMGIKPSYPETAYGYIELGEVIGDQIHKVNSYREKPNLETAKEFLSAGNYFWNSAIFVFKAKTLLEQYKKYIPDVYQTLMNIKEDPSSLEDEYEKVRNIPIDYSLMEKSEDLIIKPLDITWADIGSWRALRDIQQLIEGSKNISNSKNVLLDCQDNLLYSSSNKLITAIGIKDTVLVETEDTIFLCPAERSQELKDLLKEIKKRNLDKYL
ncbi:mannose-1-phosphate guanylyltransferase, partial [Candidatus Parcubacteria bacterium]|nr:mannose-1-phosphate guanylyltransferase [Candidatus Parcubacteria bacterium]